MIEFNTVRWLESVDASTLTDTDLGILRAIAYATDLDGRGAKFTNKQLAAEVGKVTKTANRRVPELEARGLIVRTSKGNSRTNKYSIYDLVRGQDGLSVPSSNQGQSPGQTGDIGMSPVSTCGNRETPGQSGDMLPANWGHPDEMSPVLTCGMSHPYREISKEISSRETPKGVSPLEGNISDVPQDAPRPVAEQKLFDFNPDPWGSVSAIEGSGPKESEPALEAVSSSTATGKPGGLPLDQPDTDVSGVVTDPPTEGTTAMSRYSLDPFSQPATGDRSPFGATAAADEVDYGEMFEAHLAEQSRSREEASGMVLHTGSCADAGPFPVGPVDCVACR